MTVIAALIGGAPVHAGTGASSPTPTPTGTQSSISTATWTPTPPGSIRVHVALSEFNCEGDRTDVTVVLEPSGIEMQTDAEGFATFRAVQAGDYTLRLDPPCASGSCWDDLPVTVGDGAVDVESCPPTCGNQLFLTPTSGLPGTEVTVEGACQWIHSGGSDDLYMGPIRVGTVRGNTAGDFEQTFTVPHVPAGVYTVTATDGAAEFRVLGTEPACPGDCDGDLQVAIAELVRSVGIALQTIAAPTCPVFATGASISDLVRAVRAALDGCAALALPSPTPGPEAGLCEDCCKHCASSDCVEQCFRRDGCLLVSRLRGWVRDGTDGDPIAGATVAIDGVTTTTAVDGSYEVYAQRNESCALDYLFQIEAGADGYEPYRNNFYRVPFPVGGTELTFTLVPVAAASVITESMQGGAMVSAGRIY